MVNFQGAEAESFWRVWLIRILVTATIIFVVEYLSAPPSKKKEVPVEEETVMQYTELSTAAEVSVEKEEERVKENSIEKGKETPLEEEEELKSKEAPINDDDNVDQSKAKQEEVNDEDMHADEENSVVLVEEKNNNHDDKNGKNKKKADDALKEEQNNNDDENEKDAKKESDEQNNNTATEEDEDTPTTIKFRNKFNNHPGMEGFYRWYDIETSLFRQFKVGRTDGVDVIPPYVKKSRNGKIQVSLQVVNQGYLSIDVFWINYVGHEVAKGSFTRGETWYQTTYVEHPWVFRRSDTQELLLHYIPERNIPHLDEVPTIDEDRPMVGVQRFIVKPPNDQAIREHHICSIDDKVMPHPASHHFHNPNQAHSWTLLHMQRMEYFLYNPGATLLCKYLTNIAMNPTKAHYRHIRIANKNFASGIWQTAARGLLLAAGFVEQHAYAELGTAEPLSSGLVQDVSLVLYRLEQCLTSVGQSSSGS